MVRTADIRKTRHRVCTPQQTFAAYRSLMAVAGITRLANLSGLDPIGWPVFCAIRPAARSLSVSQGNGMDIDSARVSAMMESLETWHAEEMANTRCRATVRTMQKSACIDVARVVRTRPVEPDDVFDWVEGVDLCRQAAIWVPAEAVTMDAVVVPGYQPTFLISRNGLASGNHRLEAISHALCEVIEHDAQTLWTLSGDLRQVDLNTVPDGGCIDLMTRLRQAGVFPFVWDITGDTGIPTYAAAIMERPDPSGRRPGGLHRGFGCHLSPLVALSRALTEAVQVRVTYLSGSRPDIEYQHYTRDADLQYSQDRWEQITHPTDMVSLDDRPDQSTDTLQGDVDTLLQALGTVGLDQVVAVDLTRPNLGMPVVKVVVPGLEGPAESGCIRGKRAQSR